MKPERAVQLRLSRWILEAFLDRRRPDSSPGSHEFRRELSCSDSLYWKTCSSGTGRRVLFEKQVREKRRICSPLWQRQFGGRRRQDQRLVVESRRFQCEAYAQYCEREKSYS